MGAFYVNHVKCFKSINRRNSAESQYAGLCNIKTLLLHFNGQIVKSHLRCVIFQSAEVEY